MNDPCGSCTLGPTNPLELSGGLAGEMIDFALRKGRPLLCYETLDGGAPKTCRAFRALIETHADQPISLGAPTVPFSNVTHAAPEESR